MSSLGNAYRKVYRSGLASEWPRFILFSPTDGGGWGNKLRGLTLAFVFALCTKRILVVHDFLINENFLAPDDTDWSLEKWQKALRSISDIRIMNLHLRPEDFDKEEWDEFETQSMDSLFPERLVVLDQSIGFIDALFRNPNYSDFLRHCGLDIDSKLSWLGAICRYVLSRPSPKLRGRRMR